MHGMIGLHINQFRFLSTYMAYTNVTTGNVYVLICYCVYTLHPAVGVMGFSTGFNFFVFSMSSVSISSKQKRCKNKHAKLVFMPASDLSAHMATRKQS